MLAALAVAFAVAALYVLACAELVGERRTGSDPRP